MFITAQLQNDVQTSLVLGYHTRRELRIQLRCVKGDTN